MEELREAREKQIPYKPKEYEDKYYACKCGNVLMHKWKKYNTELMLKREGLGNCGCVHNIRIYNGLNTTQYKKGIRHEQQIKKEESHV